MGFSTRILLIGFIIFVSPHNYFLEFVEGGGGVRGTREWLRNTNFGNVDNWEGLSPQYVNCSSNIFSFPEWMDTSSSSSSIVVSWPSAFIGKQIILPINGHFVFQPGITTFSDQGGKSDGSCEEAMEVKFLRTSKADWFDPENWKVADTETDWVSGQRAVPHVEKVPSSFDTVKFPEASTFNLNVPQNVSVGKFLVGDQTMHYFGIAIMMTSELGKLQWHKAPDVDFTLTDKECKDSDDSCISENYEPKMRQKICSLAQSHCLSHDDDHSSDVDCQNPILPHGFCCPICGFHVKIKHSGELKMDQVAKKVKPLQTSADYFVSRYSRKQAHVIVVPKGEKSLDAATKIIIGVVKELRSDSQITQVSLMGSWMDIPSADVDKWTSEGMSGATVTFLVFLVIAVLVGLLCFAYKKRNGRYPSISVPTTFSGIIPPNLTSRIRVPSIQLPNIPWGGGNTQAGGRTPFTFARFSNERVSRVSTVNIGVESGGGGPDDPSSSMKRAEAVDEGIESIGEIKEEEGENVTEVVGEAGFSAVTYDLVGVSDGIELIPKQSSSLEGEGKENIFVEGDTDKDKDTSLSPPPAKPQRSPEKKKQKGGKKDDEEPIIHSEVPLDVTAGALESETLGILEPEDDEERFL